jgi:hypothetical protein
MREQIIDIGVNVPIPWKLKSDQRLPQLCLGRFACFWGRSQCYYLSSNDGRLEISIHPLLSMNSNREILFIQQQLMIILVSLEL